VKSCNRIHVACIALFASLLLLAPIASNATTAVFDPISGFDNSTLMLPPEYDIDADPDKLFMAGVEDPGETLDVAITECQFLRDGSTPEGACNQGLNVEATWTSRVTWTVTNNVGLEGPVLLFMTGLQDLDVGTEEYDESEVGIVLESSSDFTVIRFVGQTGTFYYLGFLIEDFSQPVDFSFEYEVTRDIIGIGTETGGTPILRTLAYVSPAAVPQPSATLLTTVGLAGLVYLGRRRSL